MYAIKTEKLTKKYKEKNGCLPTLNLKNQRGRNVRFARSQRCRKNNNNENAHNALLCRHRVRQSFSVTA